MEAVVWAAKGAVTFGVLAVLSGIVFPGLSVENRKAVLIVGAGQVVIGAAMVGLLS